MKTDTTAGRRKTEGSFVRKIKRRRKRKKAIKTQRHRNNKEIEVRKRQNGKEAKKEKK
jgi:hypothetical protein